MSEDRERIIERVLDETLREIAAVDPPHGLDRRVMARVRRAEALRHRSAWGLESFRWRTALAVRCAATAAVLLLAVSGWLLWRDTPQREHTTPTPTAQARLKPGSTPDAARPMPGIRSAEARLPGATREPRRARPRRGVEEMFAASTPAIPPLSLPEPIAIAALQPPRIALETIDVPPLEVELLPDITPLTPSAGDPVVPESKEP